jgi:cellulose synthase/poly-beta-1,6-N-acetylglucosamine synthase-like glycosyltransferase
MKVRIAVPTAGQPHALCVMALDKIVRAAGMPPVHYEIASTSAAESKSRIVKWFLDETDADHLIMIDDDVVAPANLLALLSHKKDIVGGVYMIIQHDLSPIPFPGVFKRNGDNFLPIENVMAQTGVVECDAITGGCLCLTRKVLRDVRPAFMFRFDDWGKMTHTEDTDFCLKAKEKGYSIWADFSVECEHLQRVPVRYMMGRLLKSVRIAGAPAPPQEPTKFTRRTP